MKISYAITVCNEFIEIQRLITFLLEHKRSQDEIVVQMDLTLDDIKNHPDRKTYTIPVGNPEPKKSFKEKIKSFFKL
jgi:ATP-dependent Clp protease ATP-binding subunit ClpA